jgi:hypothetical protein
MLTKELHEEFQAALEDIERLKQAMPPLGRLPTPERLALFEEHGAALDRAEAKCSEVAHKIAAL